MNTVLKLAAVVVGTLLFVFIGLAVYLKVGFNPNDYKGEITAWVERHTGRDLSIDGPISLSLFPTLGVTFKDVTLGNAAGFGPRPFAHVAAADVAVRMLPMLEARRIETRVVTLRGLDVNLQVDRAGRTNWSDLVGARSAAPAPRIVTGPLPKAKTGGRLDHLLTGLVIAGVKLHDAGVHWDDRSTGRRIDVDHINMTTDAIVPRRPFALHLSARITNDPAAVHGQVELHGDGIIDPAAATYGIDDLHIQASADGAGVPVKPAAGKLRGRLRYDEQHDILTLSDIDAEALDAVVRGSIKAEQLGTDPALIGQLAVDHIDVRKAIDSFRSEPILTEDSDVFGVAAAKVAFDVNSLHANIRYVHVEMDDSVINGTAEITDLKHPQIAFRVNIDNLDLDRYLPPAAQEQAVPATPGAAAVAAAGAVPVKQLRALNMDGELSISTLHAAGLHVTDVKLPLRAHGGVIDLKPAAALYHGDYHGHVIVDARMAPPHLSFDEHIDGVQLSPLLADTAGNGWMSGTASMQAKFAADSGPRLLSSLQGSARFAVKNGAVQGLDLARLVGDAKARIDGNGAAASGGGHTDFSSLTGTITARDGVLHNEDLAGEAPYMRLKGKGSVNLASRAVDYVFGVSFVSTPVGQGGEAPAALRGVTVPVRVSGTLDKPYLAVDVSGEVRGRLEDRVDKELQKHFSGSQLHDIKGRVRHTLDQLLGH